MSLPLTQMNDHPEKFLCVIITVFFNVTPCSLVEVYKHFGGTFCIQLHSSIVRGTGPWCEDEASIKRSAETSVIYQTTRRHIPDVS
jgi:hypothetical protein